MGRHPLAADSSAISDFTTQFADFVSPVSHYFLDPETNGIDRDRMCGPGGGAQGAATEGRPYNDHGKLRFVTAITGPETLGHSWVSDLFRPS